MKKETQLFLDFVDQEFKPGAISTKSYKEFLRRLPHIYNGDISYRLLFDWHWDLNLNTGRSWLKTPAISTKDPIYQKQIDLICSAGNQMHNLGYQYQELIKCHARCDLREKSLLEIGGSLPNDLLFDILGIKSYVNIESPDYIEADSGVALA